MCFELTDHRPALATRSCPTAGSPVTAGRDWISTLRSLKWMNPVGQPLPDLLIRRQWKVPLQLSSEITILVGESTFST